MSLRTSRCSNSRPNGREMSDSGPIMALAGNVRIGHRFFYEVSRKTGVMVHANLGDSAGGTGEKSGEKYQVVEGSEAVDSDTYEMESGSLVQNALAVILLGALGLSAMNILAKIGVITIALISVAVRYSIIGILIVVIVCLIE